MSPSRRPYIILAIGIAAVSLAAILIRLAQQEGVPSPVIAAARLTFAALALTPFVLARYLPALRELTRRQLGLALTSGLFLAAHFYTWVSSLEFTSVLISVVLVTTTPLWVALLERFILGVRLRRAVLIGLAIAIGGGILIGFPTDSAALSIGADPLRGALLSLTGAITVAFYLLIGRGLRDKIPLTPYLWLVYGSAALILCVVVIASGYPILSYSGESYLYLLGLALIPQLIGHSSLNYAVRFLPATVVSIATQIEPISSALIAFFLFGETPTTFQMLGSLIILVGVGVATFSAPPADSEQ